VIDIQTYGFQHIIGGLVVGLYSWNQHQFVYGEVNVQMFQSGFYMKRLYLKDIQYIIADSLDIFNASPDNTGLRYFTDATMRTEEIQQILDEFHGYDNTIVHEGSKQLFVYTKAIFDAEYNRLGIDISKWRSTKSLLSWVGRDYNHRVKYVKTGWPVWRNKYEPRMMLLNKDNSGSKKNKRW